MNVKFNKAHGDPCQQRQMLLRQDTATQCGGCNSSLLACTA